MPESKKANTPGRALLPYGCGGVYGLYLALALHSTLVPRIGVADTLRLRESIPPARGIVFTAPPEFPTLGTSAQSVGDVNGDGRNDLGIGAAVDPIISFPQRLPGAAFLVLGRRAFPERPDITALEGVIHIRSRGPAFGTDVIPAGDVNGDGFADVYIHEPVSETFFDPLEPRLYLLFGGPNLPADIDASQIGVSVEGVVLKGPALPTLSSWNPIAPLKDFNGDGKDDLAFAQSGLVGINGEKGVLTVIYDPGGLSGVFDVEDLLAAGRGFRIRGSLYSGEVPGFGDRLVSAGDVNGDGLSDLAVADPGRLDFSGAIRGEIYLIFGARDFPRESSIDELDGRVLVIEGPGGGLKDVPTVFGGRDFDGDGLDDFGFSVHLLATVASTGRIFLVPGARAGPGRVSWSDLESGAFGFEIPPPFPSPQGFGFRVVPVPDENGDGRPELFATSSFRGGQAFVLSGSPADLAAARPPLHEYIRGENAVPDKVISSAGDFNADGVPDYVVATPDVFMDRQPPGRVFVLFGGYETSVLSVTAVSPASAPAGRSIEVTVTGTGFRPDARVFFGGHEALEVIFQDPHTLRARTPPVSEEGTVTVQVALGDGRSALLENGFYFVKAADTSVPDLSGVVRFVPETQLGVTLRIVPERIGDADGDGVEEYALHPGEVLASGGSSGLTGGPVYVVSGGSRWTAPLVSEEELARRAGRIVNSFSGTLDVHPVGDLNGDRRDDFGLTPHGLSAFLILFRAPDAGEEIDVTGAEVPPGAMLATAAVEPFFGSKLEAMGDFDGDGHPDLLTLTGRLHSPLALAVIRGPFVPDTILDLDQEVERRILIVSSDAAFPLAFGGNAAPIGDFNGDGLGDILIPMLSTEGDWSLRIVFGHRQPRGVIDLANAQPEGSVLRLPYDFFSLPHIFASGGRDLDGDGLSDAILQTIATAEDRNNGLVAVLFGRESFPEGATWESELASGNALVLRGMRDAEIFGNAVAVADVDGSGGLDLIVGAPYFSELAGVAPAEPGRVYVVHEVGRHRGEYAVMDVPGAISRIDGALPRDLFGYLFEIIGDQDGDGLPEWLVEAPAFRLGGFTHTIGSAYLIPGASLFGGTGARTFTRGDVDADGRLTVTDAVRILRALFEGGEPLNCEDSGDADDNGKLEITDAVRILGYLFMGGPPPEPPFPDPGPDPTDDALDCAAAGPEG